jgi:proto-oncogene tyrosine-protein kinase ROS
MGKNFCKAHIYFLPTLSMSHNRYMFWIMKNAKDTDSLYRLDLAEPSNGVKHKISPELIYDDSTIGAFTIDYPGFRLLVADEKQNTIFAVSLDG